jgi:hypothetical protein
MTRQEELEKDGWTRQFMAGEPRLSDAVMDYEEMGFEVRLEPVDPHEMIGECSSCLGAAGDRYRVIYTRPRS